MKKLLLFIALVSLVSFANAQIYYPFVDTNNIWSTYLDYTAEGLSAWNYTYYVKFTQDTVIGLKTYKKVLRSNDSLQTTWYNYGYIREATNKKIYYLLNNQDTVEKYLFNGNANVGDTLLLYNCALVVDSIDNILIGTKYRKRFNMGQKSWIEGVGSLDGFGCGGLFNCTVGGTRSLLCFTENDTLKYMNPSYNFCYKGTVGINEIKKENNNIVIYPNPATDIITIDASASLSIPITIDILNIQGQIIRQQQIQQGRSNIDISGLAKGVYILKSSNNENTEVIRFVKE